MRIGSDLLALLDAAVEQDKLTRTEWIRAAIRNSLPVEEPEQHQMIHAAAGEVSMADRDRNVMVATKCGEEVSAEQALASRCTCSKALRTSCAVSVSARSMKCPTITYQKGPHDEVPTTDALDHCRYL